MLVSICIPNYNNAKYLDMCIKSAINQTYNDIEIVFVDDGSTDESLDIANKYKNKIKIFTNRKNIGQPKTTNKCIELSRGKYLVILHSDDMLLPNMVEKLVPLLENNPNVGIAVGERILTDENNNNKKIAPFYNTNCIVPGIKQARIFMMTSYLPCQVLVRREVMDKIGGVDERHISNLDGLLWFKCCLVSDLAYIQDEVCVYRIHPEQTTANYNRTINHMMEYYITLTEMFKLAKGIKYLEEFFDTATKRTAELTLRYCKDVLKENNFELTKRYLTLATVFDPDIVNTENYKKINDCVYGLKQYKEESSYRNFSYSPPKGSITLKLQNLLNLLNKKKIIIYGAGKVGKTVCRSLLQLGYNTTRFWDEYVDTTEMIIRPDNNLKHPDDYIIIITIFAEQISSQIANNLLSLGYKNIIHDKETINSLISHACVINKSTFDIKICHMCPIPKDKCDIFIENFTNNKKIIIPTLGILVSNKCNLCCKGCNHLRYLYESKDNIELTPEEIINDLNKIIDACDFICKVVVVGGEPFIYPKIYEVLKQIKQLPKIGIINIITNGTIIPNSKVFNLLSDSRIIVEVSDYSNRLPKKLQSNIEKFILKLDKYNVNYFRMNNLQWYDFGKFDKRFYSKEKHHEVYKTCCFISNDLFKGKIHKCSRSTFGTLLSKIPDYIKDYVDVRKNVDLRNTISEFLNNKTPEVCQHCNGTSIKIKR